MKHVDIGYVADKYIRKLKNVSELQVMEFRRSCKAFLIAMVAKLLEKAPIKYPLVRALSCFDPRVLAASEVKTVKSSMKNIVDCLVEADRLQESQCDDIMNEFEHFAADTVPKSKQMFASFDPSADRLDKFMHEVLSNDTRYSKLWKVVQKLLLLSHGQASVERGFSINKQIEADNMYEQTYISLRIVYDNVRSAGGVLNVVITKEMMSYAAGARQRYHAYLDERKKEKETEATRKRKWNLLDSIDELKNKRGRLEGAIADLTKQADKWAEQAERDGQLNLISRSNSLRRTAKDKQDELSRTEDALNEKLQELKTAKF